MNILLLHTHDSGRFIQPYGCGIPTPHLMDLARDGTLFRHAFCAGPTCSPSRAALMTGMAPHTCGMLGLAHRGFQLDDGSTHLVSYLNDRGFETVLCGIQHEAPQEGRIGYRRILRDRNGVRHPGAPEKWAEWDVGNARRVADFLRTPADRPFFLSFGMVNTHRPFPPIDSAIDPAYVLPPFPIPDNEGNRKDMAGFLSSMRVVDRCVGLVLEALRETGRARDTLVLFTTDHGIAFPGMKCTLHDTGIGVSLLLRLPGGGNAVRSVDALVSHLDIFPTICDLLGFEPPPWLQGHSLLPLLEGKTDRIRDQVFAEVTFHAAYEPMRCIRTDRHKLIRLYDTDTRPVPANIDDGPAKAYFLDHGGLVEARQPDMLFDLALDPVERINRVHDPRYRTVYADLSRRLEIWMRETKDPLLSGPVGKPPGALVNRRSCVSPETEEYE